jgi:hypothetical protein
LMWIWLLLLIGMDPWYPNVVIVYYLVGDYAGISHLPNSSPGFSHAYSESLPSLTFPHLPFPSARFRKPPTTPHYLHWSPAATSTPA